MADTFSESWYKVANLKTSLRPNVAVRKQTTRGKEWYMIYDPYTENYFQLTPSYYKFLSSLSFSVTVEAAWIRALEEDPENGPGQQDVINLLVELNTAGLLNFENSKDSESLYKKGSEKKQAETKKKYMNVLFMRFPLWNPDRWLKSLIPLWKLMFGKFGIILWFAVVLYGVKLGMENASMFSEQAKNVISPSNIIYLYLCIAFVKIFHEIGHGAVCVRYGGHINTVGVMLLLLTPLPYIDATSSWAFRNKWERIYVSSAGMLVEVFLGAIACIVWVSSPPGLIQILSYNIMFTATVSTVLFNANPLVRYDGYFILSDLLEIPNLSQKSTNYIYAVFKKYIFKLKDIQPQADSKSEGFYLFGYGVASFVYRIFLFSAIIIFVSDKYFFIGVILALSLVFTMLFAPLKKYISFLKKSKELHGVRHKTIRFNILILLVLLSITLFLPIPYSYKILGVIEAENTSDVLVTSEGAVKKIFVKNGDKVKAGDVLFILENTVIDHELTKAVSQIKQIEILNQRNMLTGNIEKDPIKKREDAVKEYYSLLQERKQKLIIKAEISGYWIENTKAFVSEQWLAKGTVLGKIIDQNDIRFVSVVSQENSSDMFGIDEENIKIRLNGTPSETIKVSKHKIIPHAVNVLPSSALGWSGGGNIPVDSSDPDGLKTVEPFYLMHSKIIIPDKVKIYHGQVGKLKIKMKPEPVLFRLVKSLRQFLQKRYKL